LALRPQVSRPAGPQWFATGSADRTIIVWDLAKVELGALHKASKVVARGWQCHKLGVCALAAVAGSKLASASADGMVKVCGACSFVAQ
jgi:WD40 repeat protein